jgi:multisubunit Na+/H+ antiporter MnhE subunit
MRIERMYSFLQTLLLGLIFTACPLWCMENSAGGDSNNRGFLAIVKLLVKYRVPLEQ